MPADLTGRYEDAIAAQQERSSVTPIICLPTLSW